MRADKKGDWLAPAPFVMIAAAVSMFYGAATEQIGWMYVGVGIAGLVAAYCIAINYWPEDVA